MAMISAMFVYSFMFIGNDPVELIQYLCFEVCVLISVDKYYIIKINL